MSKAKKNKKDAPSSNETVRDLLGSILIGIFGIVVIGFILYLVIRINVAFYKFLLNIVSGKILLVLGLLFFAVVVRVWLFTNVKKQK